MGITRPRLRFPSPALILSCLALFAALGGGAFAASSVGTSSIHFTNAALENGWIGGFDHTGPPGYAKDSVGIVHLRGGLSGGAGVAFLLPKGLRPNHRLFIFVDAGLSSQGGELQIYPNGQVVPSGSDVGSFTSLAGISFAAGE
jgi:hypothetical protein